ncbi:MAG: MFS transporter [Promethearchaeota archaeon]|nr:MAG: MFS transporter [Candidatus Lokiarchaeota archaeon]
MKIGSFNILILLALFSSALFSIITPMAQELTVALNLSGEEQVAYINSLFLMVGAFSSIIWALLADKYTKKALLIVSTLEWSIFTFFTIFSTNYYSFLTFQLLTAVGFGASLPLIYSISIDLLEPSERGKKFGLLSAIYVLGNGLGQMLSGFLIDFYTWQIPILIIAIGGILCTVLLLTIEEPQRGIFELGKLTDSDEIVEFKIRKEDLKMIWKIKSTIWLILLSFFMFIAIGAISSFLISMFKNDFQFPSSIATILLIIIFGSQVPSGILFGKIGDARLEKNRKGRIQIILFCLISGALLYILSYSMIILLGKAFFIIIIIFILLILGGAFLFGGIDPLIQATLGEINPPQIRSTIYSLNYLGTTFGRSISLILLGIFFVQFNNQYVPGYLILSFLALSCSLILIPLFTTLPKDILNYDVKMHNSTENAKKTH